jgi:hypothetical protein
MKKLIFLVTAFIIIQGCSNSSDENVTIPIVTPSSLNFICTTNQVRTVTQDFSLDSYEEFVEFHSQGYTNVNGTISISNAKNLTFLSCLKSVDNLSISHSDITNLNGLQNLEQVNRISIYKCGKIINFQGIGNISTLHSLSIFENEKIFNLQGLESLTTISSIFIHNNTNLKNLTGINNLTTTFESNILLGQSQEINITNNMNLNSLVELNNISTMIKRLYIYQCPSLTNLGNFNQLSVIGYVSISYCNSLTSINCFNNIIDIGGLNVAENSSLQGFNFPSLTRIGTLSINNNPILNSLQGFSNLTEIYGENGDFCFEMDHNPSLLTLNGLENLATTSKRVEINEFSQNDLKNTCALSLLVNNYLSIAGTSHLVNHISVYSQCGSYDYLLYNFNSICNCI